MVDLTSKFDHPGTPTAAAAPPEQRPRPHPGEAAFPYVTPGLADYTVSPGLTKREYFAALAMQGLIVYDPSVNYYDAARQAVDMADALIAALQPPQS